MQFEKAELMRKKIEHLENYQARSVIVNKHIEQADVFSIFRDNDLAYHQLPDGTKRNHRTNTYHGSQHPAGRNG